MVLVDTEEYERLKSDLAAAQAEVSAWKKAVEERTEYAFKNEMGATPFRIDVFIQNRVAELLKEGGK